MVESPCIKVCELNAADICVGCGRSRAEIAAWRDMTEAQKAATVAAARNRLRAIEATTRKTERA